MWWRKSLLLLFALGCAVSMLASGRFTARLIIDGMISFAFVPIFEIAAFAVVYRIGGQRSGFAHAANLYLVGNSPWLAWLTAVCAASALASPIHWPWWPLAVSMCPIAVWSAYIDFCFFGDVLSRPPRLAVRDLILIRAMAWTAAVAYFFGIAIWSETLPELVEWVGL